MTRANFDHYVTQHYLKLFTKEGFAYLGDIESKSVSATDDFTDVFGAINWSVSQEVEDFYTSIEGEVAKSLKRVSVDPSTIGGLAKSTRSALTYFICIHIVRSTGQHDSHDQAKSKLKKVLKKKGMPDFQDYAVTREDSLSLGMSMLNDFYALLHINMDCIALTPPKGGCFIIGDNPCVRIYSQESLIGKGDMRSRDTYMWFPLNPQIGLLFGYDLGGRTIDETIKTFKASSRMLHRLNRSEVFLAKKHILGNSHGLVKGKVRLENISDVRTDVRSMGWSPYIITENKNMYHIPIQVIDEFKKRI